VTDISANAMRRRRSNGSDDDIAIAEPAKQK